MSKLIYGVGLNDLTAKQSGLPKDVYQDIYKIWAHMLERCYSNGIKSARPTYSNCSVCKDWLVFSNFLEWVLTKDWKGKCLDKDLLRKGNKIYSPDRCLFISKRLNSFLTDRKSKRGDLPIGVSFDKRTGMYAARCSNPITGKNEWLGRHSEKEVAHRRWKERKFEIASELAKSEKDKEVSESILRYFSY